MKLWYFLCVWLAIIKLSQNNRKEIDTDDSKFRLPKTVIPKHYTLKIQTFMEKKNFKHISSVKIKIYCIKPTNKITLHSRKLKIKSIKLIDDTHEGTVEVQKYELEPKYDFLHIYLNDNLMEKCWYILEIDFEGKISNGMAGYYRSSYQDKSGQTKWIATTQFEPISARRAFPCFDEPALRARFSIQLGHRPHLVAISNMPLEKTELDETGWVWDTFGKSLKMPTYLVAYAINDFGFQTTIKSNKYGNTSINVWAPKKSLQQVKFALKVSPDILSFFEEYFNIPYPLDKSELLAVPDFSAGAMENWGLITFRDTVLLYVPGVSTENDKNEIVNTIAHETAHYWFGNLVTIKWWTYLWLKEGFATYLARVAVGHLFPDWEIYFSTVLIEEIEDVYAVDGLESSRPVSVPITDPNTINEIFDGISYSKGSCVIRMMEGFLGEDVLRKGLTYYLNKYKYSSTEPDDLWNSLTKLAHREECLSEKLSVKEIMDTWTEQNGFPLVTVVRDYTKGTVTVTQRRFLENMKEHDNSCYWIPLTYTTSKDCNFSSTKAKKWLQCPKQNITFELDNSKSWIIFNVQALGLYRVNYDKTNWKLLINQLESDYKKIELLNRVLLIDDVLKLAMTGYLDFKIAFDLVRYVRHDDQYNTWSKAIQTLLEIDDYLYHTSHYGLIQTFISNLVIPEFKKLGGIKNIKKFSEFQLLITSAACSVSNEDCEQQATNMFKQWKRSRGNYTIPEDIRKQIFCQGVQQGGQKEWNYLWKYYLKSNAAGEKSSILKALGCTRKQALLVRYLKWMIKEDSGIRHQDAETVFASVMRNKDEYHIARSFFYENFKDMYKIQSPKGSGMKTVLKLVADSLKNETEYKEFEIFVKDNKRYFKMARLTVKQMLEKLVIRKHWYDNLYPKVVHALQKQLHIAKRKGYLSYTNLACNSCDA